MKLKKLMLSGAILTMLSSLNSVGAAESNRVWSKQNGSWYLYDGNDVVTNQWHKDSSNHWYWLKQNGQMATGWEKVHGTWYFFNSSGEMQTGWKYSSGSWYYLKSDGEMKTDWGYIDREWYFFDNDGAMQKGVIKDNSNNYYVMSDSGEMKIGKFVVQGLVKQTNSSGKIIDPSGLVSSNKSYLSSLAQQALTRTLLSREAFLGQSDVQGLNARLNMTEVNREFLKLLNRDRNQLGLPSVSFDRKLSQVAEFRSRELANQKSIRFGNAKHTRPGSTTKHWSTVLDEELSFLNINANDYVMRENLAEITGASASYRTTTGLSYHDPKEIAAIIYDTWKASPGHYKAMMSYYHAWSGNVGLGIFMSPDSKSNGRVYDSNTFFVTLTMQYDDK